MGQRLEKEWTDDITPLVGTLSHEIGATFGPRQAAIALETERIADVRRGRGSLTNPAGRFEAEVRIALDDEDEPQPLKTQVTHETARSIITRNASPDLGFDRSINVYRGCEHGCSYCFARPTHAYLGLSPGLDFETRLFAKTNAPELLERELAKPGYQPKTIALGTNTDPYQPIERQYQLTRRVLEVLERTGHPVTIVTKSHLVTRDSDILARMAARGLAKVALSVTTLDRGLARAMEPRASTPARRLEAMRHLSGAGIPVGVMVAPLIPAVNDHEIERILDSAHAQGAREAGYVLLRMPHELRDLFRQWLVEHRPHAASRALSLVQDMRGGKDYDATFGLRQTGKGPYALMIARRFEMASIRLGFEKRRLRLTTGHFVPPVRERAEQSRQLSLF